MIKKTLLFVGLVWFGLVQLQAQDQNNFKIAKSIETYASVLRQLNLNYADSIDPEQLTTTAIKAMLSKMDPYTVFIPPTELDAFKLMTRGEYGGMGALIQKQGHYVVITEPYQNFPAQKAGLRAGDKILSIDGKPVKDLSSSKVSSLLKGVPGSTFTMTIQHFGDTNQVKINIKRQKIKIPNVPYYGVLKNDVGYIGLTQFNPNAANDVRNAFLDLKKNHHIKGLILDLRNNGGGLLNEAVDIVNIFVKKGQTVVTTKGKNQSNTSVRKTKAPVLDAHIPLAVLVNENTASASEIVAGSLQDLDRAVIIGQRTFGKGLVQNIVRLPYGAKMKVTIAKYYIPSGRCIQAIDYFHKDKQGDANKVADSLISTFKTKHGRLVHDGGGLDPDVKMKTRVFSQLTADLYAQNYIFNFANRFYLHHPSIESARSFRINDSTFSEFKHFVSKKGFSYKTETEALAQRLKESAGRENYYTAVKTALDSLNHALAREKKKDLDKHKKEIDELLRMEIVTRYFYQAGKAEASLVNDNEAAKAVDILTDKSSYKKLLTPKK
jgi:carboxyl-terminal processing protease